MTTDSRPRPAAHRRGRPRPARLARLGLGLLVTVTVGAGCTAGDDDAGRTGPGTVTVGTVTHTLPPSRTVTRTVTAVGADPITTRSGPSAAASSTSGAPVESAPATTEEPDAEPGSCPYLPDEQAIGITGQRNGQTMVIDVRPQPICIFYRSDGGWMAAIRVVRADDPAAAVAAVDGHIPRDASSPADMPAGWTGGYMPLPDGAAEYPKARSVYGVSKGRTAVIAWTNQEQSIKARRLVVATIAAVQR